jgi:hypothetical protein
MSNKFVPPVFNKFGKKVKDLFKKKYDFENKIVTKHKTKTSGLTFESGGTLGCQDINGYFKGKYKDRKFGEAEAEVNTAGKLVGTAKFDQLAKGLEVNYAGGVDPKKKGLNNKLGFEFAQEFFATTGSVDVNHSDTATSAILDASGVVGWEGVSVGGQVSVDVNSPQKPKDYNVGAEYTRDAATFTVLTEEKGDIIHGYYLHQVSSAHQVGVQFDYAPLAKPEKQRVLTLGTEYQLDVDTSVKAKADTTGLIQTAIQHNLQNPSLQLGLAASFSRKNANCLQAEKFGLSLTFGDY